jgi:hypothetical protein
LKSFRLIAALLFVAYVIGIGWGLPSTLSPAKDSIAPYSVLAFVGAYGNPAVANKYPALHHLLLGGVYAVILLGWKIAGYLGTVSGNWPFGMREPVLMMSSLIVAARLISIGMGITVILSIQQLKLPELDKVGTAVAMFLLAASGVFTYYTREANVDVPMLCWWVISFVALWKYAFDTQNVRRHLLLSAVAAALAIATKDGAAGLVVGAGIIVLLIGTEAKQTWTEKCKQASLYTGLVVAVYSVVAILPQPWRWIEHLRLNNPAGERITRYSQFENTFAGQVGLLRQSIESLAQILSPFGIGLFLLGVTGLLMARRYKVLALFCLPLLTYYGLFIVNLRFVYERFLLPVAFLAVIVGGIGVTFLLAALRQKSIWLARAGIVALVIMGGIQFVIGYLPVTYVQIKDTKGELARAISNYVAEGQTILWIGSTDDLPNAHLTQRNRLLLPPGIDPNRTHISAVLRPYEPDCQYVLCTQLLDPKDERLKLIGEWKNPAWTWSWSRGEVRFAPNFYLYHLPTPGSFDGQAEWKSVGGF